MMIANFLVMLESIRRELGSLEACNCDKLTLKNWAHGKDLKSSCSEFRERFSQKCFADRYFFDFLRRLARAGSFGQKVHKQYARRDLQIRKLRTVASTQHFGLLSALHRSR
jgi:hypothetical protein